MPLTAWLAIAAGALFACLASTAPALATTRGAAPACLTAAYAKPGWASVKGANVRIHYKKARAADRKVAQKLVAEVDTRIWPKYLGLLQRAPLSDLSEPCYHGEDGLFDVYLDPKLALPGQTKPAPASLKAWVHGFRAGEGCNHIAAFSAARPTVTRSILAHELYHAFQDAYARHADCLFYGSWDEATADWAMQWVYPDDQAELDHPQGLSKIDYPISYMSYHAWVLPYYLERTQGPDVMRQREFWSERLDADEAMDRAITGGFAAVYPEFALYAWNQAPIGQSRLTSSFAQWDRLMATPTPAPPVENLGIASGHLQKVPVDVNLLVLERRYRRFTFAPGVRRITFSNGLGGAANNAVGAFVKVAGESTWRVEDWSGQSSVSYCRDRASENVEQIILALSNRSYADRLQGSHRFVLEDSCALHYTVLSSSWSTHASGSGPSILCGTQAGTRDFSGASTEAWFDADSRLDVRSDGTLAGPVIGSAPAQWTNQTTQACTFVDSTKVPCSYVAPTTTPQPDGSWQVWVSIEIPPGSDQAKLDWAIPDPEVGWVDAGDDECYTYLWGPLPSERERMTTAAAPFLGTAPFDVTFNGNASVPAMGMGGTLDYAWSYHVQLQRVDADGNPIV